MRVVHEPWARQGTLEGSGEDADNNIAYDNTSKSQIGYIKLSLAGNMPDKEAYRQLREAVHANS